MALTLLTVLIAVSQGQDYLDGGYVSSGDSGEIGQYFTDPVFSSPSGNYVSSGPVVTRHSATMGYIGAKPVTSKVTPSITTSNAAGSWHLELTDSMSIDLVLHQSGNVIFGQGSVTSAKTTQWAAINGVISGNSLRLAVVPASGTALYVISLDIVRPSLGGSFTAFKADGQIKSGAARGNRMVSTSTL
jgi:hypothetical protein